MINEFTWTKFPRYLTTDPKLRYIEKKLPAHLKNYALLFMMHAYCSADNSGAIDIEDGVIIADILNIDDENDVKVVADLLASRGMLIPIDNSTVYLIEDWDVTDSIKKRSLTAEERRTAAADKIRAEQKTKSPAKPIQVEFQKTAPEITQFFTNAETIPDEIIQEELQNISENNAFLYPDIDKKNKNVATQRDKRENIRETKEKKEKKETHTQESALAENLASAALGLPCNPAADFAKETTHCVEKTHERCEKEQRETETEQTDNKHTQQESETIDVVEQLESNTHDTQKEKEPVEKYPDVGKESANCNQ